MLRLKLSWIYLNAPTGILSSEATAIRKARVVFGTPVLVAAPGYDPSDELVAD